MQPPRRIPRIAIVGGGPGGLFTAHELQRLADRPVATTILEASGRLGGKISTPTFESSGTRYEAGAAEFYDYEHFGHDPLKDLVRELGLRIRPMGGPAVLVDDAVVANLDDLRDRLGAEAAAALLAFDTTARDRMTPREFYAAGDPGEATTAAAPRPFDRAIAEITDARVRRFVEQMIHSDLATEPHRTSEEYGLQNYLMNDPAYMRLYCIAGGNEQLIDAIAARITADIRLGTAVTEIRAVDDGGFELVADHDRGDAEEPFDAVVVALPLQHLAAVQCAGEDLAAAIRRHVARFDHPAHYLRVTALFDEPFWRGRIDGGYLMLDAFGGCCLYDESAREPEPRHGVLGWLLGGAAAEEWAGRDDDALVAAAIDSLPAWLGDARPHLLETRVHRWTGAVSALPGGWRSPGIDRRHQPDPAGHPHLLVVGDYLYDSTLNGVLDSAEHVAGWLAAEFG
jgi:monoamine oxidase